MKDFSNKNKKRSVSAFEYAVMSLFILMFAFSVWLAFYYDATSETTLTVNSIVYMITLLFTVILFVGCMLVRMDKPKDKRIFEWLIILSFLSTFFAMFACLCNGQVKGLMTLTLQIIANSVLGVYWIAFWLYQNNSYPQTDFGTIISALVIGYMAIYILFSLGNFFVPIFFVTSFNGTLIFRTDYFTLTYFMVWYIFYLIYVFTRKCSLKVKITLSSYVLFPLVLDAAAFALNGSEFFRSIFYSINGLCFLLPLYLIYFNLHIEQGRKMLEQKEELTAARINLMVSQIQPHFIYNSLSAIIELIDIDTEQAKDSIVSFSDYLRVNLNALKDAKLVPFDKELEHCKTYLGFELLRFDNIKVEYDIETTAFMLPALTVQPLLENAVKHGVSKTGHGGTVRLSVKDEGENILITVSDDGVGFDTEVQLEGVHIGLENVSKRLSDLCGGQLKVQSMIGKGTEAIVLIPKKQEAK